MKDPKYENSLERREIHEMALFLGLCHTILVEETKNGNILNSASPDELALVNAAKYFGYEFIGRDENGAIMISEGGEVTKYPLLNVLEFNSTRKGKSVIVRMPDERIMLFCNGADNMI